MRAWSLALLLAGCGAVPVCPAGLASTGWWGTCCLPGQGTSLLGACEGTPAACPDGWDLTDGACARRPLPSFRVVQVPAGNFLMGCLPERDGVDRPCQDNPPYEVTLTKPFVMMAHEVSQGLYEALTGTNPTRLPPCPDCPVDNVSWLDAVRFANRISAWEQLAPAYVIEGETVRWDRAANGWRLPTEAEWEYAARAGEEAPFAGGFDLDAVAVHDGTHTGGPSPGGSKAPNPWGLHDMSGNLWEWTWSAQHDYPTHPAIDPTGPDEGGQRVVRGGGWSGIPDGVYLSTRGWIPREFADVILGFRLVRDAAGDG